MKVVYLESTQNDLLWFHEYYTAVFPEGANEALKKYKFIENLLADNPYIGKPYPDEDARKLVIPKTPFSYIYRVNGDCVEILRVWDDRQHKR